MAVAASSITYFAFCLPIVLAPALIVQRRFLNKAPTLRGQIHLMREQVSRLAQTNLLFGRENDRLVAENARLGEIEERLAQTARQNGTNLHDMMILIKENSAIQKKTKVRIPGVCACRMEAMLYHDRISRTKRCCRLIWKAKRFKSSFKPSTGRIRTAICT
jgi:hypothetical protein